MPYLRTAPTSLHCLSLLVLLASLALCIGCSRPQKGRELEVKGVPYLTLLPSEHIADIDKVQLARYQALIDHLPGYDQPLHRIVVGPGYTIYSSIVIKTNQALFSQALAADTAWQLLASKSKGTVQVAILTQPPLYAYRLFWPSAITKFTHVINILGQDSFAVKSLFASDSLFHNRFAL